MSKKHIDTNALTPKPVAVRTILTAELAIRFEGQKPRVKLMQLSDGTHEVNYIACGTTHWRTFDTLQQAEDYFRVLTGEVTPRGRVVA